MAAVSHLKNRREAKTRDSVDKIVTQCTRGDKVSLRAYHQILTEAGVPLPKKEEEKLEKMSDDAGDIGKMEFMAYAKQSSVFRMLVSEGTGQPRKDKAEIAFKALDRDNSGYITVAELGSLGPNIDLAKAEVLLTKLDTDGDGKISLSEFKRLFKQ